MAAYYNEIEPFAAQWIRNLISAGLVAPGDVDERSIEDVRPDDLRGYTQCHFFAGIGIWSYALRRAGWSDDRPVWTGSCPCQPFSAAGKGGGFDDERHLWPAWHHLIRECRPPVVFGEQVSAKDGLGWFDLVQADLEAEGYACGPLDLCAAGVGAPHIRQRLFFVADHHHTGLEGRRSDGLGRPAERSAGTRGVVGGLALTDDPERRSDGPGGHFGDGSDAGRSEGAGDAEGRGGAGQLADGESVGRREERPLGRGVDGGDRTKGAAAGPDSGGPSRQLADDDDQRRDRSGEGPELPRGREPSDSGDARQLADAGLLGVVGGASPTDGFWRAADWVLCRDPDGPKWRPVRPSAFVLVDEYPARVGKLRAYGNAIVAEVAQTFIESYLEHKAERDLKDLV